jgi:hypothetical protein
VIRLKHGEKSVRPPVVRGFSLVAGLLNLVHNIIVFEGRIQSGITQEVTEEIPEINIKI